MSDHIVDATKMVPPADLVERVKTVLDDTVCLSITGDAIELLAGHGVPDPTISDTEDAARAVIALFAEREKAAAGLLEAALGILDAWESSDWENRAVDDEIRAIGSAIAAAKAAGIGGAK